MTQHRPTAIIHLGDIYYSGTPAECQQNFTAVFDDVFANTERVPIFTIPGNHEYYSFGVGFHQMLQQINPLSQPNRSWQEALTWQQPASYFCLRTVDRQWQFLGMDTSQNDMKPMPANTAPALTSSEIKWHQHKLQTFPGKTILLSHHQLFSTNSKISDSAQNHNQYLYEAFRTYFDKVAAWFWGHEHNLALYQNGLLGVAKGRLLGCSAYEESQGEDPYKQNYPQVPYQPIDGKQVQVGLADAYYNHGYAIIDFARATPTDPISVSYYQIPSWAGSTPKTLPPDQPDLLATETLG